MSENSRIGFIGIMIEDLDQVEAINDAIHRSNGLVVARMGIPYRERGVSVISLVVDGTNDEVSALTGRLGRISGVTVKSMLERKRNPSC